MDLIKGDTCLIINNSSTNDYWNIGKTCKLVESVKPGDRINQYKGDRICTVDDNVFFEPCWLVSGLDITSRDPGMAGFCLRLNCDLLKLDCTEDEGLDSNKSKSFKQPLKKNIFKRIKEFFYEH